MIKEAEAGLMFGRCPSCHWPFQAKETKRELLASDEVVQKDPFAPAPMEWEWQDNFETEKHVHTYKVTYKCKHCSYQWNDIIQQK